MEDSRPSSPEEPPQDLWSSILDSVSSSRSIPSKQVLLLGESSSGKSTITAALLRKPVAEDKQEGYDFAVGYDWADVRDDADEDTLARLSVYAVPSSASAHLALLPHFVPPRAALPHSAVMIVLDWTKPWTFVSQLQSWLAWVEAWVKGDGSRDLDVLREENRERLQSYIQRYTEPMSDTLPTSSTMGDTLLPLGPGTLTHNTSGVPIIVVCAKADLIDDQADPLVGGSAGMGGMVKGKGSEWEEQTDGIMQVLRVICLKYGAALFYTTQTPQTLHNLRQYSLHMLFVPAAPSPGLATESAAHYRNPFPFTEKPNILDRDRILVPIGWDSWGKIAVLRDGFDAKMWGEAWDNDLQSDVDAEGKGAERGARSLYSDLVPDRGIKPHPLPPFNEPMPEQAFLAKNYDENAKKGDRDPRAAFRNQNEMPGQIAAGIVGPMGSSSFNLPNVEKALTEMEGGFATAGAGVGAGGDRKVGGGRRDVPARASSGLANSTLGQSTSSRPLGGPSPPPGQSQHEVLQNFFQSLLSSRGDRGTAAPSAPRAGAAPTNGQNGQSTQGQNGTGSETGELNGSGSGTE
ncbi:uncharacterized protein FOMMEDRAFT_126556 [Fomitiporia mediterranea MF3/22]|uniref:uncharacterized protein n=1 Tax=Fomitiporia mediterranea (strain MF3/22) TaxID=694068 RepID=UPI0004407988|nr:uncharacterized protein FOMMEDRAFT_126556 [Fomitiporia mediterranea MF3/22]EJD01545.1 hypothetical protein FOMMEDRAFT_126556 [Fomitiporia mediterranea MF3/22]